MNLTYLLLDCVFIGVIVVIDHLVARRYSWPKYRRLWVLTALIILTTGFDTFLTGLPIVRYHVARLSGLYLGTIPLEDFAYTLAAPLIVSIAWVITGKKNQ